MQDIAWERYSLVAQYPLGRRWLSIQANLGLAVNTIDAYGRGLEDFLVFCAQRDLAPETVTREHIALYVHDLATRPNPRGRNILLLTSGTGLSNATMQQRITVVRLFCDFLMEDQARSDNPVGRGYYVPGKAFGGARDRGLLPHYHKLPWIPSDEEWRQVLSALKAEPLRNQVMLLLAYEGALRREELLTVEISDFDFAYRHLRVRAEHAKNGVERLVGYSEVTSQFLERYLHHRRTLSLKRGPLFLSESHRNAAQPLSLSMWSKIVASLAARCDLPRFTTHTPRHLRLTHLARAKLDLHQIARYAGHRSLQTTMLYIHLSGVELNEAVSRSLSGFESWIDSLLGKAPK
jgi:site-specific recombinase XerD